MDFLSDFEHLIEILNFNYSIALLMEYCAFFKLRTSSPNIHGKYKTPLGVFGCFLLFLPSILPTILATCVVLLGLLFLGGGVRVRVRDSQPL
jgi:hypothetical protein